MDMVCSEEDCTLPFCGKVAAAILGTRRRYFGGMTEGDTKKKDGRRKFLNQRTSSAGWVTTLPESSYSVLGLKEGRAALLRRR